MLVSALQDYRDKSLAQKDKAASQTLAFNTKKWEDTKDLNERKFRQAVKHQNTMAGIAARNATQNERRTTAYVNRQNGGVGSVVPPLDTPKGQITPNGRNYSNQIEQIWSYAREKGLVQESDVERKLRSLGLGKDKSSDIRHQMVLDLLRTNQSVGDYAAERLGWRYGGGTVDPYAEYAEDEEDDWDDFVVE